MISGEDRSGVGRWLVALDIDGTVLYEDGGISPHVIREVRRVVGMGHEVTLATGRSVSMALPVLDRLGIVPQYVVCANGAIVLERDTGAPMGYTRCLVETFDPTEVLETIRSQLSYASFAVEDADGLFRYTGHFPAGALATTSEHVDFDELLGFPATRLVVFSPDHETSDFLHIVDTMGLNTVSYSVGWTNWLDIAPEGVTKATALERVRRLLDIPRTRVFAIGDGRNDIDMLAWASAAGLGYAMGQSPPEVVAVANRRTGTELEDGAASALARSFQAPEQAAD